MGKKFRETMWFKKGMLDAQEAEQVAAQGDDLRPAAVDMLPVEDRYLDDGSVTREDSAMYSVHTGTTQCVPTIATDPVSIPGDVDALVRDMKRGRTKVFAAIGASVAVAMLLLYVM